MLRVRIFVNRITPAYAGKSRLLPVSSLLHTGSPPPMRGKVRSRTYGVYKKGITPAYAGKSI